MIAPFEGNIVNAARQTVGETVRKIGTRLFSNGVERSFEPPSQLHRYRSTADRVCEFLLSHAIEPTPANYALVYRHEITGEPGLEDAIASMIANGHAPSDAAADSNQSKEEDVNRIVEHAQENLRAVEELVRKSGQDTKGFGDALESQLAANPAIDALIGLTRTMMDRTRAAEDELKLRGKAMTDLQMSLAEARIKADTDALTGLNNRRAFERHLGAASARAAMSGRPLSLAICDIDLFKSINDTHGHCAGDRVLQFVSTLLQDSCGAKGHVSRHGGEEFVVVFEETAADEAYEIIDAVRRDLKSRHLINRETGQPLGEISFSAGVSSLAPKGDVGTMLRSADRALYKGKAAGRDRVVIAAGG